MAIVGLTSPLRMAGTAKSSPAKIVQFLPAIAAGVNIIGGISARRRAKRAEKKAKEKMKQAKKAWMEMEFVNPYQGLENPYSNLENVYEDTTVDTQAYDYLTEQTQQQQANLMQQYSGAAGSSGIAALAQGIANIGLKQSQQVASSISQQERTNELAALQEQARIQQLKRTGAFETDMLQRKGDALVRKQEMARLASIYGLNIDNLMAQTSAKNQASSQIMGGISQLGGAAYDLYGVGRTRDWKTDIGKVKNFLNIG